MSKKRLQVVFEDEELAEIQETARRHHTTVAEWVRQTLREARLRGPVKSAAEKLQALRRATEHEFPTSDIETMLDEIERGYREPRTS